MATSNLKPYQSVEFEPLAYRRPGETEKALLTESASQQRLQRERYDRHPSPPEEFSFVIDHFEHKLPSDLEAIAEDMLTSHGERLGMRLERKGKILVAHLEQGGWPMRYATQQFSIGDFPSEEFIDLKKVPEELAVFLYSKPFDELPEVMRKGDRRAQIYLPPEGVIHPVSRSNFDVRFVVYCGSGASRGVRQASGASAKKTRVSTLEETLESLQSGVQETERSEFEAKLRRLYGRYIK